MLPFDKPQKEQYINYLTNRIIILCDAYNFSSKNAGYIIRIIHVCIPAILFAMTVYCSQFIASLAGVIGIMICISFYLFNGCAISMVETRLCCDTFNIFDPLLYLVNMEPTYKNRILITIFAMSISLLFFLGIYYNRFISPAEIASVAEASVAEASVAEASVAEASVAEASVAEASVAEASVALPIVDIPEMMMTTSL